MSYIVELVNGLELALTNLTSPPVLAFALGALAVVMRSDLRLPDPIHTWLASYLLLAIGLKGGVALRSAGLDQLAGPALVTLVIGISTPIVTFAVARRLLRLDTSNAGSFAAHFGSVSVVTFTAADVFATEAGFGVEGFMASLVALLEIPGIIVALLLVGRRAGASWRSTLHEVMAGRSVLLLVGGLVIGAVASDASFARVEPFFVDLFTGILVLFLLDMGATAAARLRASRSIRPAVIAAGIVLPVVFGSVAVVAGSLVSLSIGGAAVLGAMAASASYIAAPAAVRTALPDADPGLSLGIALGVTFPFNLALGIPLYTAIADRLS